MNVIEVSIEELVPGPVVAESVESGSGACVDILNVGVSLTLDDINRLKRLGVTTIKVDGSTYSNRLTEQFIEATFGGLVTGPSVEGIKLALKSLV